MLEKSVLGTMLKHNYLISDSGLTNNHFVGTYHQVIYQVMKRLVAKNQTVDTITLMAEGSDMLGDLNYIVGLSDFENIEKFDSYIQMILANYQKRQVQNILRLAQSEKWELEQIQSALGSIEMQSKNDAKTAYELALEIIQLPFEQAVSRKGIQTGLTKLDRATGGLINGELIIIAARPSIGKTALMLQLALATQKCNEDVLALVFSLEMSGKSLAGRIACNLGHINQAYLKVPEQFTEGKKAAWIQAMGEYSSMNIITYDKPAQTMAEIRSKIRKAVRENSNLQVVAFIDYLTLITPADNKANTHVQVSQISRDLKNMAREFDIPVVCLGQLNRSVEQRHDKRPMLSDLRESGSIEQDADIVALLYRDSYYDTNKKNDETLEINIAKNRAGITGTILANYNRAVGVITDAKR